MSQVVQLFHESAYLSFVKFREVIRPVIFVTQSPDNNRRMVPVRVNHIRQHPFGLCLIAFATQSAAAPGDFFPYEDTQFVT